MARFEEPDQQAVCVSLHETPMPHRLLPAAGRRVRSLLANGRTK
jgi:hypothetical protein